MSIVRVTSGGIPVTESPLGLPYEEALNGLGIPVTFVDQGGAPLSLASVLYSANINTATTSRVRAGYQAMLAGTRNMVIAIMGDSTDRGVDEGALPENSQYPLSLAEQLASAFRGDGIASGANNWYGLSGTNLADFMKRDRRLTVGGTTAVGSSVVQGGAGMSMSSSTATMTFTPQGNCTKADIYTLQNSAFNGAQLAVQVDGVATATITQNTTNTIRKTTVSLGSSAPHTITINWVSGANALYGIDCYDDTRKEVTIRQWAQSGGTASQMIDNTGSPNAGRLNQMALFPPDLVIGDLGIVNSWRNGTAVATVKTQVETLIDAIHAAGGDFIFLEPPFDSGSAGNTANQQLYVDAVNASCIAKGCGIFRTRQALVSKAASDAAGYTRSNDAVHYTIEGQAWRAGLLKPILRYGMGLSVNPTLTTGGLNLSGVLPMDVVPATWTTSVGIAALTSAWQSAGNNLFDLASGTTIQTVAGGYPDVATLATALGISPTTGIGGALISKWYDQSGNGDDPVQATGANQPAVWLIYGKVYLFFGGALTKSWIGASSEQYMTIPTGASFNNRSQTGFAIVKPYTSCAGIQSGLDDFSTIFTGSTVGGGLSVIAPNDFFSAEPLLTLMDTGDFSGNDLTANQFTIQKSVVSWRGSASARVVGCNGTTASDVAAAAGTYTGGLIGAFPSSAGVGLAGFCGRMTGVMVSSDEMSDDEMGAVLSACYSYADIRSAVPTTVAANIVIDGASYNQGLGSDPTGLIQVNFGGGYGWSEFVMDGLKDVNAAWHNTASSGASWATSETNFSRFAGACFNASAALNILVSGDPYGNSMNPSGENKTGAQAYADFLTWLTTAKTKAWDEIIVYILNSPDTEVQAYNTLMLANAAANEITLVDMSGDTRTDNTQDTGDAAYFVAGHPNVAGSRVIASYMQPAIQAAL